MDTDEARRYADGLASSISQPALSDHELSLFSQLLDMAPQLCKPHDRETPEEYEWGCARLGALAVVSARKVTLGWLTIDQVIADWEANPSCTGCPLAQKNIYRLHGS